MTKWTYLGSMGHRQFATETVEGMAGAIAELEAWMNRQPTTILMRCKGETEADPVSLGTLRATDPSKIEEVFVVPRMAGG